jgi:hypothetical protein
MQTIRWGLPFHEYQKDVPALNPSVIVECDKSPFHAWHAWNFLSAETPSLQVGKALHSALLEPRLFAERYKPAEQRRTKKYVEEAAAEGVEYLLPKDFDNIVEAARRASLCKDLQRFIKAGQSEVSLFTDEFGCQVKGRLDWISTDPLAIFDVKTARDIDERWFSKAFYQYHYDVKLGLYQRWLKRLMNADDIPVYLLVVENQGPWDCAVVPRSGGEPAPLPNAVLERGAAKGLKWIEQLRGCIERDEWPGVGAVEDWTLQTPYGEMNDEEPELKFDDAE